MWTGHVQHTHDMITLWGTSAVANWRDWFDVDDVVFATIPSHDINV